VTATVWCLWSAELYEQRDSLELPAGLSLIESRPGPDPLTVVVRMRDEAADPGWDGHAVEYAITRHDGGALTFTRTLATGAERWRP
jgi:hypothetical protein